MLRRTRLPPQAAFTLIEAMIALAILATLMATGAPSLVSFIQNQQLRSSAEDLQSGLSLARAEAMRRNARVNLWLVDQISASCVLSARGTAWVVSQDNPASDCTASASGSVAPRLIQSRGQSEGGNGVLLAASDANGSAANCFAFNGLGQAETACANGANPMAQIDLSQAGGRALRLVISAGGAVRLCDPALASGASPAACS